MTWGSVAATSVPPQPRCGGVSLPVHQRHQMTLPARQMALNAHPWVIETRSIVEKMGPSDLTSPIGYRKDYP